MAHCRGAARPAGTDGRRLRVCDAQKDQEWLDYLSQYDFTAEITEVQQDGEGVNICGDGNGVNYGAENQENHQEADH